MVPEPLPASAETRSHYLRQSSGYHSHSFKEYTVKGACVCGWTLWAPISRVDARWATHIDGDGA